MSTVTDPPRNRPPRATPRSTHETSRWAEIGAITRLARRTSRTNRGRNALIIMLILLPVAVATVVAIGMRSSRLPADAFVIERFGTLADVRIHESRGGVGYADLPDELQAFMRGVLGAAPTEAPAPEPVPDIVERVLPGTAILPVHERSLVSPRLEMVTAIDLDDPLAEGLFVTDAPTPTEGEVLLTRRAMDELGTAIGQTVSLGVLGDIVVTGEVAHPHLARTAQAVVGPGILGDPTGWLLTAGSDSAVQALLQAIEWPPTSLMSDGVAIDDEPTVYRGVEPRPIDGEGQLVQEQTGFRRAITSPSFAGAAVGGLLLVQVGLVAAAAFATGTRRRVRQFGLLGSAGASPRQINQLVLSEGLLLGAIGAGLGALLGLLAALGGRPLIERMSGVTITAIDVGVTDLLAPAAVGLAAALLAAWWPARTIATTPTVTALAGRVPLRRVPAWLAPLAVAVTVAGLLLMLVATQTTEGLLSAAATATAAILTAVGAATLGVPLLGLVGSAANRLPVLPRLVVRDAVRQRMRSGAAVAALVVVLMLPVIALTAVATDAQRFPVGSSATPTAAVIGPYLGGIQLPVTDAMVQRIIDLLPDAPTAVIDVVQAERYDEGFRTTPTVEVPPIASSSRYGPGNAPFVLATDALVDAIGLDPTARSHLDDGGLLDLAEPGTMTDAQREAARRPARLVDPLTDIGEEWPMLAVEARDVQPGRMILVTDETADALGLDLLVRQVLLVLPGAPGDDDATTLSLAQEQARTGGWVELRGVVTGASDAWVTPIVLAAALLVALVIVGMTTALAATESDRDLSTMTAVGADPRMRPRFHGLQAAYHTALAGLIATPAALLLFRAAQGEAKSFRMVVPWLGILLLLVLVPALVGGVLWPVMRPAHPVFDRRIS